MTVWDINTGAKMLKLSNTHGKQEITCMSIDTGGKRLLTGARNGNVKVRREDQICQIFYSDLTIYQDLNYPVVSLKKTCHRTKNFRFGTSTTDTA